MRKSLLPASQLPIIDLVDEAGEKLAKKALFDAECGDRLEDLKKELRKRAEDHPKDQEVKLHGRKYLIVLGMKRPERKIPDMAKLYHAMKLKLQDFLGLCSISLKHVDEHLTEDQQKDLVVEDRTGWRSIEAIRLEQRDKAA